MAQAARLAESRVISTLRIPPEKRVGTTADSADLAVRATKLEGFLSEIWEITAEERREITEA